MSELLRSGCSSALEAAGMPDSERYDKGHIRNRLMSSVGALRHWDQLLINDALGLAEEVHHRHHRKGSRSALDSPPQFILHPMRVALILIEELQVLHPEPVSAALLHDVVEDSQGAISTFHLEKKFGRNVALMVSCMTRPVPDAEIPRAQQIEVYQERIAQSAKYTRVIKLAERLDNMRDLVDSADTEFQQDYLQQTVAVYLPIAEKTDATLYAQLATVCEQILAANAL